MVFPQTNFLYLTDEVRCNKHIQRAWKFKIGKKSFYLQKSWNTLPIHRISNHISWKKYFISCVQYLMNFNLYYRIVYVKNSFQGMITPNIHLPPLDTPLVVQELLGNFLFILVELFMVLMILSTRNFVRSLGPFAPFA